MGKRWLLWARNALVVLILGGLTVTGIWAGTNITFNGASYTVPAVADASWGQNVTNYLIAIASGALQKTGGAFTLTQEVDFGSTYGLKSQYFKSKTSTIATTGVMRMGTSDALSWRNAANNADLPLLVDASNHLDFNGSQIYTNAASATANGYLASSDWTTFNAAAISVPNTRTVSTTAPLAGGGALSSNLTLSITQSSASGNGYLSSADWQTFNQMASGSQAGRVSTGAQTIAGNKLFQGITEFGNTNVAPTGTANSYGVYVYDDGSGNGWLDVLTSSSSTTGFGARVYNNGTYNTWVSVPASGVPNFPQGITLNGSPTLSGAAGNAGNGYLSSSDWQAFNSIARVAGTGSVNGYLVSSDWTAFNSVARVKATSSVNGYLGSSDWTTFNTVQTAVQNTRSVNTTAPLSGGGALSSDLTLSITQSGNAGNGYLSSSDWQAFNSIARVAGTGSVNGYLVSSDWTAFNSVARVKATSSVNGYLGSSDWTTFNSPASTSSRGSASYEENGTYSAPFTGPCSVTATVKYSRMGKVVCNVIPLMTCGSTAAVIFQTATSTIPSELRPSADNVIVPAATESGGAADTNFGGYVFNSSGAIYLGRTAALTAFGSSGTAGTINQAAAACYTVQ